MKDQTSRFLELLATEETKLLTSKTSWARNELSLALGQCKIAALGKLNDEIRAELLAAEKARNR